MISITGWQCSDNAVNYFATLSLNYKNEAPKMFADLLNDMAFSFRALAPHTIEKRYFVRHAQFVRDNFFVIQKASPRRDILDMEAVVSSNYMAHKYGSKFTGFTEELGEPETRSAFWTVAARGTMFNAVQRKYKPAYTGMAGYNQIKPPDMSDEPFSGLAENRRRKAFVKSIQIARGVTHGRYNKKGVFLGYRKTRKKGAETPAFATQATPLFITTVYGVKTLSHFKNDDIAGGIIESLKVYKAPYKKISLWSWDAETQDRLGIVYTDDYIYDKYVKPLFHGGAGI